MTASSAFTPNALRVTCPYDVPPVLRAQLHRMYMAKSVMMALRTMSRSEGNNPALENAMGSVKTPPPHMLDTSVNMEVMGELFLSSES